MIVRGATGSGDDARRTAAHARAKGETMGRHACDGRCAAIGMAIGSSRGACLRER
ncbi:hypothetical protein BURK1_00683 [Burkholderiales bacterium]|nr:hypothetical protein BURK1_00683 [Burkholderiales bacterium]